MRLDRVEVLGTHHGNTYWSDKSRATYFVQAIETAAGCVNEWHHRHCPRWTMSRGDRALLRILFTRGKERAAVIAATVAVVRHLQPRIERVARELKQRDLTGAEVRRLIRAC